ncbi:MAG: putative lipoprotein [Burkholderiaceae bacterium]|nr:putative lipoprotein [Burkholderiaceae bacterium]
MKGSIRSGVLVVALALVSGCATQAPVDYSAFQRAKPASLLVLPPVNDSPDTRATPSVWSHATRPLSEAGYYVLPVTLVDETLKQNGIQTAVDAQEIPLPKLREVFGADAGVFIKINRYGTSYLVVDSETRVELECRIVDLRSGDLLWSGRAMASSAEQAQQNQGGLIGLLVAAVVKQIIGTSTDAAYNYAGIAQARLLGAPRPNGVLPGPRSPIHGQVPARK